MEKKNILLVLTGGTICSFDNGCGEQTSDVKRAEALIVKNFREGGSPYASDSAVSFDTKRPLDVLSENMTVEHWNTLKNALASYSLASYDGVIILHGTDTLAYTASLLSILLAGTPVPVILVSADLPIYNEKSNGNKNFKAAVELIVNGILPNVYAVYANREAGSLALYIHYGSHLLQCANHSSDFYSSDMAPVSPENAAFLGKRLECERMPLYECPDLSSCVLRIAPYVGLDYGRLLLDGVRAILHGTYHSSTLATDASSSASATSLLERCNAQDPPIAFFIEPCDKNAYSYETTGKALRGGARPIDRLTSECAYAKLLVGCALGYAGAHLEDYINTEINGEFLN